MPHCARLVALRGDGPIVVNQGNLAVDDQVLIIRQLDNKVGQLALALIVPEAGLGIVVVASLQARPSCSVRSNCASPQLPVVFLSPFRALVRLVAWVFISRPTSSTFLISDSSAVLPFTDSECTSLIRDWKPVICSRNGFSRASRDSLAGGGKALALVFKDPVGEILEVLFQVVPRLIEQRNLLRVTDLPARPCWVCSSVCSLSRALNGCPPALPAACPLYPAPRQFILQLLPGLFQFYCKPTGVGPGAGDLVAQLADSSVRVGDGPRATGPGCDHDPAGAVGDYWSRLPVS